MHYYELSKLVFFLKLASLFVSNKFQGSIKIMIQLGIELSVESRQCFMYLASHIGQMPLTNMLSLWNKYVSTSLFCQILKSKYLFIIYFILLLWKKLGGDVFQVLEKRCSVTVATCRACLTDPIFFFSKIKISWAAVLSEKWAESRLFFLFIRRSIEYLLTVIEWILLMKILSQIMMYLSFGKTKGENAFVK